MRFYLDSAIWRDLHENRNDNFRPLGEWAFEFLRNVRQNKSLVLYSEIVVKELLIAYDYKTIAELFKNLSEDNLLVEVAVSPAQLKEASLLRKKFQVPLRDALHAVLARDNNAVLIARDRHFEALSHLVRVNKPEDLI
jgi:predicted nucleic acid-binding protein